MKVWRKTNCLSTCSPTIRWRTSHIDNLLKSTANPQVYSYSLSTNNIFFHEWEILCAAWTVHEKLKFENFSEWRRFRNNESIFIQATLWTTFWVIWWFVYSPSFVQRDCRRRKTVISHRTERKPSSKSSAHERTKRQAFHSFIQSSLRFSQNQSLSCSVRVVVVGLKSQIKRQKHQTQL